MYPFIIEPLIRAALLEDLGRAGDITTAAIVPSDHQSVGSFVARQAGIIAGLEASLLAFTLLDTSVEIEILRPSGSPVSPGETIARLRGPSHILLTGERTALNLLGRLSGIATLTNAFVQEVSGTNTQIVCTRKTTPGLRALEKDAVRMGGGRNHRFGLDDAILIKDNHLVIAGSISAAVKAARAAIGHLVKIELEVDTLEQLDEAVQLGVDLVLLDNMSLEMLTEAVKRTAGQMILEASGTMRLERVRQVAQTGVNMISVGALTHSSQTLDIGLDLHG